MQPSALLAVFMEVGSEATEEEFHDWYENEHVPLRTEGFAAIRTAARYRAIDGKKPKFVAMYTLSDLSLISDPAYTGLRDKRSEREADIMGRLEAIDRRIYTLISDTTPLPEAIRPSSIASGIIIMNSFTPAEGQEETFNSWYENEYVPAVKDVPGFVRTRRYELNDGGITGLKKADYEKPPKFLELTEFDSLSALHSPQFPKDTFGTEVISSATATERRVLKLFSSFEPLAALKALKTPTPGGGASGRGTPAAGGLTMSGSGGILGAAGGALASASG